MKKYEYKLISTDAKGLLGGKVDLREMDKDLNKLGQEGWDLVEILGTNQEFGNTRYIISVFKREVN